MTNPETFDRVAFHPPTVTFPSLFNFTSFCYLMFVLFWYY